MQLLYTAGLVSAAQQKESAIRAHLAPLFKSASPLGHHRALRRASVPRDPGDHPRQPPLSMGSSRQECCSAWPCVPPGALPNPGIEPVSLMSPALAERSFITGITWEARVFISYLFYTWCH